MMKGRLNDFVRMFCHSVIVTKMTLAFLCI